MIRRHCLQIIVVCVSDVGSVLTLTPGEVASLALELALFGPIAYRAAVRYEWEDPTLEPTP